jgi:hypothetical protein
LNFLSKELSNNVLREYLEDNHDGVTSLKETENWDMVTLFSRTFSRTADYLFLLQRENFIESADAFSKEIIDTLVIIAAIMTKLIEQLIQLNTKQEYFDDPDDPPIPRIEETLYFVE